MECGRPPQQQHSSHHFWPRFSYSWVGLFEKINKLWTRIQAEIQKDSIFKKMPPGIGENTVLRANQKQNTEEIWVGFLSLLLAGYVMLGTLLSFTVFWSSHLPLLVE